MKKILIIGGKGQLGNCFQKIAPNFEDRYEFNFTDSDTLDITDSEQVFDYFYDYKPDFCINASAYTAVDLAETESEKAFAVNEAMNKLGTTRYSEIKIDNYFQRLLQITSTKQAHGVGAFDIRYYILKNSNWSLEEKRKLVMNFWYDNEVYIEYLEAKVTEIVREREIKIEAF